MAEKNEDKEKNIKLQRVISELERLSAESQQLVEDFKFKLNDHKIAQIKFRSESSIPYLEITSSSGARYAITELELNQVRDLIVWLSNLGIGK